MQGCSPKSSEKVPGSHLVAGCRFVAEECKGVVDDAEARTIVEPHSLVGYVFKRESCALANESGALARSAEA